MAGCPSGVPLLAVPSLVAGRTGSVPLPPLDLVVVSASGVLGGGGGSFFRPFGFPEVGTISFPAPFRRLSVPPLAGLEGQGCGALGCRGAVGGLLSALSTPPLSNVPIPMPSSSPTSIKGAALEEVTLGFIAKGAVELTPLTSPGFYSRLFVVWQTSGSWRPVIDLSHLIRFVDVSPFQMETIQSVLLSVRQGDWMASIHLMEAYLQVLVPPVSRHFLRFMFRDTVYQFQALCFGLSTAPQVFTRVLAPVSAILHSMGFRIRRYLDDWLVQSTSRESLLGDLQTVPQLCHELGDCGQPPEFQPGSITGGSVSGGCHRLHLFPGFYVGGAHLPAAVDSRRVSVLRLAYRELMAIATRRPFFAGSPSSWRQTVDAVPPALPPSILGSSGSGGSSVCVNGVSSRPPVVAPSPSSVSRSVSLPGVPRPTLLVIRLRRGVGCPSRSSDRFRPVGRPPGGVIHKRQGTACCPTGSSLQGRTVAVFCDNTTAVASLRKEGGTRSPLLTTLAQEILRWTVSLSIRLPPQFLPGSNNVLADALSRPHQLPHSTWSLILTVFQSLRRLWPVQIDLFAASDNHRCSIYFSPFRDPMSAGTDAFLQSWADLLRSLRWQSFLVFSRSSGPPRGRSSL